MEKTIFVCILFGFFVALIESKCLQKNTKREAHRDIFMCDNQYFEDGKRIADPENCECYYQCNFNQQPCYVCCLNGQVFHPKLKECVLRNSYHCENKPPVFNCPGTGLFRHHEHCRKYWDCRNGLPVEEACQHDHHWDDRTKVCRKDSEVVRNACTN